VKHYQIISVIIVCSIVSFAFGFLINENRNDNANDSNSELKGIEILESSHGSLDNQVVQNTSYVEFDIRISNLDPIVAEGNITCLVNGSVSDQYQYPPTSEQATGQTTVKVILGPYETRLVTVGVVIWYNDTVLQHDYAIFLNGTYECILS
jgi:hypothetical protein